MIQTTSLVTEKSVAVEPRSTEYPVELCILEYTLAAARGTLRADEPRLSRLVLDLVTHSLRLMDNTDFRYGVFHATWDSAYGNTTVGGSPLTFDLIPDVRDLRQAGQAAALRKFIQEDLGNFSAKVKERISALQNELTHTPLAELNSDQRAYLTQLSRCVLEFVTNKILPALIDQIRPTKPTELVAPIVREIAGALSRDLPAGSESLRAEVIVLHLGLRLASLQHARVIDDSATARLAKELQGQPQLAGVCSNAELVQRALAKAKSLGSEETLPTFAGLLNRDLPPTVISLQLLERLDTLADIAYQAEIRVARQWLEKKASGLAALLIKVRGESTYELSPAVMRLEPAIKTGMVSTARARELLAAARPEFLAAGDTLKVHLMAGRAPRVLETIALTGAQAVTVYGDYPKIAPEPNGEVVHRLQKALILAKGYTSNWQPRLNIPSIVAAFGSGEQILRAELAGVASSSACHSTYLHEAVPPAIHALERHCGGSIAWVEGPDGVKRVFVFDSIRDPALGEWRSIKLADGVVCAVPLLKTEPKSKIVAAVAAGREDTLPTSPPSSPSQPEAMGGNTGVPETSPTIPDSVSSRVESPVVAPLPNAEVRIVEMTEAPLPTGGAVTVVPAPSPSTTERVGGPAANKLARSQGETTALHAATLPPPPPNPQPSLPPELIQALASWVQAADEGNLFGSILGDEQGIIIRKAGRGKLLSAGERRSLSRLLLALKDSKRVPVSLNLSIPTQRAKLANILDDWNAGKYGKGS